MKSFSNMLAIVAILLPALSASAARVTRATEEVTVKEAQKLVFEGDFGVGEIRIEPESMDKAAVIDIEYTPKWVDYDVDYRERGNTGYISCDVDIKNGINGDDLENTWRIQLSDKYPTEVSFDIGACEARFDFGGIPLTNLDLDIGASSGRVEFSKPNPERLEEIKIDVGASSLELLNMGNANFNRLELSSGAASVKLDLTGALSGEAEVDIDVGVGSLDITVPRGVAVRIESDEEGWFSSVDFDELDLVRARRDVYESRDFDSAETRLIFTVDVGMGSVEFHSGR